MEMNQARWEKLKMRMREVQLEQLLVTDTPSIYYLTGRWIESGERLLVLYVPLEGTPKLLINELFPQKPLEGVELVWLKDTSDALGILCQELLPGKTLGIDKNWPSGFLLSLMERWGSTQVMNSSLLLDGLRAVKEPEEVELMREVSRINDDAMGKLMEVLEENLTEKDVEERLAKIYANLGADGFSFTPIIAFGKNGADPHHMNGLRLLNPGDAVILDIGCRKNHYCADMTRTVFFGHASEEDREVYETVRAANEAAIDRIKPGVTFAEVDAAARDLIAAKGYGPFFTHRTGHSIGIEVHEPGDVSSANKNPLVPGMIFSVEPGIYLEGKLGVRIEDLVVVTPTGAEVLNQVSKELRIL